MKLKKSWVASIAKIRNRFYIWSSGKGSRR
jgi:hypothetical protein